MAQIMQIIPSFDDISFVHIYREQNGMVDAVSKRGMFLCFGMMTFEPLVDGSICADGSFEF